MKWPESASSSYIRRVFVARNWCGSPSTPTIKPTESFTCGARNSTSKRLVPLSADATREIDRFLAGRRQAGAPCGGDAPLLVHQHGARFRGYTGEAFGRLLRKVIRATDIQIFRGRAPRVHDLRFTFAVHALLRWCRTGVDVQDQLPALATYLGHTSVVSIQYYLTLLKATAEAAGERFHTHSAAWLFPRAVP